MLHLAFTIALGIVFGVLALVAIFVLVVFGFGAISDERRSMSDRNDEEGW